MEVIEYIEQLVLKRSYLTTLIFGIGAYQLSFFVVRTILVFTQTLILSGTPLTSYGAKKGAWAVITGSSDGIGREFAIQLGSAGLNILLVARNKEALERVAEQIRGATNNAVSVQICLIDFAKATEEDFTRLQQIIDSMNIGVLGGFNFSIDHISVNVCYPTPCTHRIVGVCEVNNVGRGHSVPNPFIETPLSEINDIIAINVQGTLRTTHLVVPTMIRSKQRSRGLVINVGSLSGAIPISLLSTYSASKSFMATWSAALREELKDEDIDVVHLNAFYVETKLSNTKKSLIVPDTATYVSSALGSLGWACGAALTGRPGTASPFWGHALLDWIGQIVPGYPGVFVPVGLKLQRFMRKKIIHESVLKEKASTR
ncbi:hypothetical protein VNI00_010203 [Paramarasmius palmivorus]|uniref:Very-long-chain 3-oxoacyl-CoA reductase n=1 Tax=Paramarasmius palmivorus TaxID=297713 RepID=A0AAW0BVX7_9AGAR